MEKTCKLCGISKQLDDFHRARIGTGARPPRRGYGRVAACKACVSHMRSPFLAHKRQQRAGLDAAGLKYCNVCRDTKPRADFAVRRASPDGLCHTCRACAAIRCARWKESHPGAYSAWHGNNRERKRQQFQKWRQANLQRIKQTYRAWAKANTARINALIAKRNALKLKATPPWVDHIAIRAIYKDAAKLTVATGIRHEVDHIVPLRHPNVCGLHIPENLQILTSDENKRKSNHFHISVA